MLQEPLTGLVSRTASGVDFATVPVGALEGLVKTANRGARDALLTPNPCHPKTLHQVSGMIASIAWRQEHALTRRLLDSRLVAQEHLIFSGSTLELVHPLSIHLWRTEVQRDVYDLEKSALAVGAQGSVSSPLRTRTQLRALEVVLSCGHR